MTRYINVDSVKFIGGDKEQIKGMGGFDDPTGILEVGKVYEVRSVIESGWSTEVKLRGIKGIFNSVLFVESETGKEVNYFPGEEC